VSAPSPTVAAVFVSGDCIVYSASDLAAAALVALGAETHGLRNPHLETVTIPMAPGVESLNVAAAAAVLLFEVRRRLAS